MRTCLLLMRPPCSSEDGERLLGMAMTNAPDVAVFLLGDGVVCARNGPTEGIGPTIAEVIAKGGRVTASGRDIRARGIGLSELLEGVSVIDDLEGAFLDEAIEKAERVFAW